MLLLLVAAGLLGTAVGRLQTLGFLPATGVAWDTSWLLDDHGTVGGFLTGLVGYRAQPSTLEVAVYAVYVALAGWLFFGGDTPGRRPSPSPRPGTVTIGGKEPLAPR